MTKITTKTMKKTMTKKTALLAPVLVALGLGLAGCEATYSVEENRINLASYEPIIDTRASGFDRAAYSRDLDDCRLLGLRVQADYEARRKDEQGRARRDILVGTLAGAAIGAAVSDANNSDRSDGVVAGALYGAAIGAESGESQIDTDRALTRFGPTVIVDQCMIDRGHKVLVQEQLRTRAR